MSVYQATSVNNVLDSDAKYQAMCQHFEAALLASGFLEVTSDTGQLNLATVTKPSVASTYAGYRMYRAKDPIAGTNPFYVKAEYGVGSATDRFAVRRSMGTGSNGAGTLTGPTAAAATCFLGGATGSGSCSVYGGGGESDAWVLIQDTGVNTQTGVWAMCRFVNPDTGEAESADNLLMEFSSMGSGTLAQAINWSNGATAWAGESNGLGYYGPEMSGTLHSGGDINTTLLFQHRAYRNAKLMAFPYLSGRTAELPFSNPDSSQFSVNVWGSTRTFVPIPMNAVVSSAAQRLAMLWEA